MQARITYGRGDRQTRNRGSFPVVSDGEICLDVLPRRGHSSRLLSGGKTTASVSSTG